MRLFFAVPVTDAVRASALEYAERLKGVGADVKWVKPQNFHVTLRFLGWTPDDHLPSLERMLETIAQSQAPFNASLDKLGCFGRVSRPAVIWAGVGAGAERFADLAAAFETELVKLGFTPEDRPFTAHLTLGRVKSNRKAAELGRTAEQTPEFSWPFPVRSVRLMESKLSGGGADYVVLKEYPLTQKNPA